jgi:peptidoglycan/LPS O-acetylase OafA/YrhL
VRGDIGMIVGLGAMAFIFVPVRGPVPILSFLGSISYSLYLVHNLIAPRVFNLLTRLPPHAWLQIAALLLSIAITMAIAWLLWRLIERPTALLAKRIGRGQ